MVFFDDILNVYAYMFSKSGENTDTSRDLTRRAAELETSFQELNGQADTMLSDMDALLARAYALADEMNVDTTGVTSPEKGQEPSGEKAGKASARIQIPIPVNFDYHQAFRQLVKEAHAAGFVNTHPEELLTEEEMAQAEAYSSQLDEAFCDATRLQKKDMAVLSVAVAARVLCYFLARKIRIQERSAEEEHRGSGARALQSEKGTAVSLAEDTDIAGGKSLSDRESLLENGKTIASAVSQKFSPPVRILDHNVILNQNTPFDIQETNLFGRDDIVAYHKYLGWLVGTVNILTDTITTYGMKSYAVARPVPGKGKPAVDREISTLLGVVGPVLRSGGQYKDSIAAAAVQEALLQGYGNGTPEQVRTAFGRTMELEKRTKSIAEETKGTLGYFNAQWAEYIGGVAVTALINTIVSAVHAMLYEESDGDLDTYSIRTGRIILYSGAIAATVNSLPAIASRKVEDLDLSGILMTCISWFQTTRFWIEAKTAFLVSSYRETLDRELNALDSYFVVQM